MAIFKGVVITCKLCGSAFKVPPSRAKTAEFCSIKCAAVGKGERRRKRLVIICVQCGKPFEIHACHADRRRYCSAECKHGAADYLAAHAERSRGSSNGNWKGGVVDHSEGYIYMHAPDHPYASNGYVFAHRLAMERWLRDREPGSPFLIRLGEQLYLSPEFVVHHDDENKRNNAIGNLACMTHGEHQSLHERRRREREA